MDKCSAVLVVEDNNDIRDALEVLLRDEGYNVYGVRNGREALRVLEALPFRPLVLLDMMMPGMDGWEFLERSAAEPALKSVPVVVVSALGASSALAKKNTPLPAIGYFKKPVDAEALLETIERHCLRQRLAS